MGVAIGIDSHKSTLEASALDNVGRVIAVRQFANDERGHRAALRWFRSHGPERVIGIEGSGGYGAALARTLAVAGEDVHEVPAFVTHRERRKAPAKGKSDAADAIAIARIVARGDGLQPVRRGDIYEDIKLLCDERDRLVRARTEVINRIHADLVVLVPGYERRVPKLTAKKHVAAARRLLRGLQSVRAELVRIRLAELERLDRAIAVVETDLRAQVAASGTTLTELKGVGVVIAAKILGEVGDVRRLRSKAGFAMLTGTAPVPASSGYSKRHRLNRGGNRQLNFALHTMARVCARVDEPTRAYLARQRLQGKTDREAIRCLKRQLSNVVYRKLLLDASRAEIAA